LQMGWPETLTLIAFVGLMGWMITH